MADLIDRKKIKAKFEPWLKVNGYSEGELNMLKAVLYEITIMPSAQPDVPVGDMISRQAAIDEAYAVIVDDAVCDVVPVETLEALPSVDAVEVVRCKDCKWYDPSDELCLREGMVMDIEDFCSRGE